MAKQLEKIYDPKQVEDKLYAFWVENGYFHAEPNPDKKPFTIVIPPPNITGQLHMGHALDNTLQDILIRFRRMQGYETLWMPGTDHASIATEAKIVSALKDEGLTKAGIGRNEFLKRAWEWRENYGGQIINQLKKLGSSCDWERERFTLDEGCSKAVTEVFCSLYEKGLIYRGERMINWCPNCKTSISDAEVEYKEQQGAFWHIRYPLEDGSGDLIAATTRPETMLGDTGLAISPKDTKRAHLVGKAAILPLVNRRLPIVADEYVEMDFGTGVVKMTPAHDPNDFEVGQRHNLEIVNIFNEDGTINENGGKYAGMDRFACRKAIVKDLEAQGYLVKTESYDHNVGCCQRCTTNIEPRISTQWFVDMKPLAAPAIKAVREGDIRFVPERFDSTYFHFMENIRDWCISRQLWWGHDIPAWYCDDCGETIVSRQTPTACTKCAGSRLTRDPDTLDTWFSSALWPFSTLGWPEKTPEFEYFFPTDVLVTGYDIIFFWVARMIFSSIEQTGSRPFQDVLIHGLVRDAEGRKMSKSLGNGIDPLEIIEMYGADALRLTLASGNSPGNDMRFSDEKVRSSRNFCNKIWNAARFILMNLGEEPLQPGLPEELTTPDRWVLSKYNRLVGEATENIEKYELGIAVSKLYDFVWDVFCDWYIELAKPRLLEGGEAADATRRVLVYVLSNTLAMLHPFMPFITEEIWQTLPHEGESVMVSSWPKQESNWDYTAEEQRFETVMAAIKAIRMARANANVPPSKKATVYIKSAQPKVFSDSASFIERLAFASSVVNVKEDFVIEGAMHIVTDEARILIPMNELVNFEVEKARLNKEQKSCEKEIDLVQGRLNNQDFVSKAPQKVIEGERDKLAKALERLEKIKESLFALGE
jgi:valyl-tRNA synthetase